MQKSIKGQGKGVLSMRSILIIGLLLLQSGCTATHMQKHDEAQSFSCEEVAAPKSLQALEQQYRCHAEE